MFENKGSYYIECRALKGLLKMNGKYHQMNEQIEQWDLDSIIRQKRKSTFKVHFCLACLLAWNLLPGLISERGGWSKNPRGYFTLGKTGMCASFG